MSGSRTVRVVKRDGSVETFDPGKLAGVMWRAMRDAEGSYGDAIQLSLAIEVYLTRSGQQCVSSAAVLEMGVKVLRRVGLEKAADAIELHHSRRSARRRQVRICHTDGRVTYWDKTWLAQQARGSWDLSRLAARILAGYIEREVLDGGAETVDRGEVLERLNATVAAYGLADAVPVPRPAGQA